MRPANSTGHVRAWTAPTSGRKRGTRHRPVAGRPAEDEQQAPPDLNGRGNPLKVITTAANANDVTRTLAPLDGIPPVAGRPGRPDALLGDKGYDSSPNRDALRKRRILPVTSRKGCPEHQRDGQTPLRRRADLRAPPPLQASRRPLGTPHRTPRRLRLPGLQPDLLETQEGPHRIVLRALMTRRLTQPPDPVEHRRAPPPTS